LVGPIKANYPDSIMNDTEKMYDYTTEQAKRITALATALARYLYWASLGILPAPDDEVRLTAEEAEVGIR
jgi:hypothetical protein